MADDGLLSKRRRKLFSEENEAKFPEASAEAFKSNSQVFATSCQNSGAAVHTVTGGSQLGGSKSQFFNGEEIRKHDGKENLSPSSESSNDSPLTKLCKVRQKNRLLKNENQYLRQNLHRKPMSSIHINAQNVRMVDRDIDKGETSNLALLKKTESVKLEAVTKTPRKKMKSLEEMIKEISADVSCGQVANKLIMEKCVKLESKVKNKRLSISKYHGDREDLYKNLNKLTENFVIKGKGFTDIALSLLNSQFQLLHRKDVYEGKQKLQECVCLTKLAEDISQTMAKQGKSEQFRKKYFMLDEIVGAVQKVGDIKDILGTKSELVSWCLRNYANCCYHIGDFCKSSELANRAICLMQTVHSSKASQWRVLAYCYRADFASHCHNSLRDEEKAGELRKKALEVASDVKDWKLDSEKMEFQSWINDEFRKAFNKSPTVQEEIYVMSRKKSLS